MLCSGKASGSEHVSFLKHPAAKSHTADNKFVVVAVGNVFSLPVKILRRSEFSDEEKYDCK